MPNVAELAVAALVLSWPAALSAQAGPPEVLRALEGTWEGSGTLLGRTGAFTMAWSLAPRGFARLSFTNAWIDDDGATTPVLAAEATYLVRGDSATGVWVDDRPRRITLVAALTDSTVITNWSSETEAGRTEYVVRSPTAAVVRDFVIVDGVERLFAEATYRRR
jgi:hypothetical protein